MDGRLPWADYLLTNNPEQVFLSYDDENRLVAWGWPGDLIMTEFV